MGKRNVTNERRQEVTGTESLESPTKIAQGKVSPSSAAKNDSASPGKSKPDSSQLLELFENELKDLYWAEKALKTTILKMVRHAESYALVEALESHWKETSKHVGRLEKVFEMLGKKPRAKKCEGMKGLIKEAERLMKECEAGPVCDAAIISAAQKMEHYEIASYGTLQQFAETLDLPDAAELLAETLAEEKAADEKLTEIAVAARGVNASAKEE